MTARKTRPKLSAIPYKPSTGKPISDVTAENCKKHYLDILNSLSILSTTTRNTRSSAQRQKNYYLLMNQALSLIEQFPSEPLINLKSDKGGAIIHHVAKSTNPEFLNRLLANKQVDIELVNKGNDTAACLVTNHLSAKILIRNKANLLHKRNDGNDAIECIYHQAHLDYDDILQAVLDSDDIKEEFVIELVKRGAPINTTGEHTGVTILQLAGQSRYEGLKHFYHDAIKKMGDDNNESEPVEEAILFDTEVKMDAPTIQTITVHSDDNTEQALQLKIITALSSHITEQINRLHSSKIIKGRADKINLYERLAEQLKTPSLDQDFIMNAIITTATISHHRRLRTWNRWFGPAEATSFIAYKQMIHALVQDLDSTHPLVQTLIDSKRVCEDRLLVHINQLGNDIRVQGYDDYRSVMETIAR